jgi:hypothetical protein
MRKFFYIGPNRRLKSGFSINFWKIETRGRTVTACWGPAGLDHIRRRVLTASWTQTKSWTFESKKLAKADLSRRITEPTIRDYFFERIRPIMEKALRDGDTRNWPLITLNLDFKTDEASHHAAIWQLLQEYESWICSAERTTDIQQVMPLTLKPLLVLTGEADSQQRDFYDIVPVGERLLAFGAVHVQAKNSMASAEILVPQPANNYRRWWNNPWNVVEEGGQRKAGGWTSQDEERLQQLVFHAHKMNLWIRFYTLNGHSEQDRKKNGWDKNYNFGSKEKVLLRWKAAVEGRVDFLATDQYEDVANLLHEFPTKAISEEMEGRPAENSH